MSIKSEVESDVSAQKSTRLAVAASAGHGISKMSHGIE